MDVNQIVRLIQNGQVVAFCGAGLSCGSGIPAFRGEGGLWEKYDPQKYVTEEGIACLLQKNPSALRDFVLDVLGAVCAAVPNEAHHLLARLEKEGVLIGTITQNIDGLHVLAGTQNLAFLHGDIYHFACSVCGQKVIFTQADLKSYLASLAQTSNLEEIVRLLKDLLGRCPACDGLLKSSVVLFGQMLPADEFTKAQRYIEQANVLLCIGTSGTIYPAASVPFFAREREVRIITVNPHKTLLDEISEHIIPLSAVDFARQYTALAPF